MRDRPKFLILYSNRIKIDENGSSFLFLHFRFLIRSFFNYFVNVCDTDGKMTEHDHLGVLSEDFVTT
jgi:hypothetical protein